MKTRTFSIYIRSNCYKGIRYGNRYTLVQYDTEGLSQKYSVVLESNDRNMVRLMKDMYQCGRAVYYSKNCGRICGKYVVFGYSIMFDTVEM